MKQLKTSFRPGLLAVALLAFAVTEASAATVRVKVGNAALPAGTVVMITLSGDGCPCSTPIVTGTVDKSGYATITLSPSCRAIDPKCLVYGIAVTYDASGKPTIYKGSAKPTLTSGSTYQCSITLTP